MVSLLTKWFIKDRDNVTDTGVRRAYGMLCSILGIVLNVVLFAGKYFAGVISGSIAIMADAFNNLSDAGASLITLLGFKFAGIKADSNHPFGHGRIEYIAGFVVSMIILLMGFELLKSSVGKILNPEPVDTGLLPMVILAVSICIKLYMSFYNRRIGKKINSAAMRATAADSLSDTVATVVVLISMLLSRFAGVANLDGWCGVIVALFILYAGYGAAKDTLSPLLGQAPDPEFVKEIQLTVLRHPEVLGIHDLVVHDYGPGRVMVSLHAEVSASGNILVLHDTIDLIERELETELGCEAVIHMDPIADDDEEIMAMRAKLATMVHAMDEGLSIHDFRVVRGPTHSNLIFDVVVPFKFRLSDREVIAAIEKMIQLQWENCFAVITVDRPYSG